MMGTVCEACEGEAGADVVPRNVLEHSGGLVRDYENLAAFGVKRVCDLSAPARDGLDLSAALARLLDAGFAAQQDGAIVLRRGEDCPGEFSASSRERLDRSYAHWLRADARPGRNASTSRAVDECEHASTEPAPDELLYGELGFWQHWWNRVRERDYALHGPLSMDIVVPDDGSFAVRRWLEEFDPEIRTFALSGSVLRGRVIVPPQALGSVVEPILDLSTESGLEVRVLSTEARFVLYDSAMAILAAPVEGSEEGQEDPPEPYRAVRSPAIVDPLRSFFELLWQSAAPFAAHRPEQHRILALLAKGHTDLRIAAELKISPRSVSRRVSEIMAAHGASSRFELGVMYGRYASRRK